MAGLGEVLNITKGHKLVMAPGLRKVHRLSGFYYHPLMILSFCYAVGSFPRGVVTFIDQIQDFIYGKTSRILCINVCVSHLLTLPHPLPACLPLSLSLSLSLSCSGCTLTGAAGGGFLVGILKDPAEECRKGVMEVIKNRPVCHVTIIILR